MPRKPRQESPSGVYHFMTRGVNKKRLFHSRKDYEFYLSLIGEYSQKLSMQIYHYCLMTNHVHILLKSEDFSALSWFSYFIQRRYAYYYCKTHQWSEQVFRRNFVSVPISEDSHLLECGRYIERNPTVAKIEKEPGRYPYTSYAFYAFGRKDSLITESPLYETLGNSISDRRAAYQFYVIHNRPQLVADYSVS